MQANDDDDDIQSLELSTPPKGASGSKRTWEYDVPEISIMDMEDKQVPEMPNLESMLGNSLQSVSAHRLLYPKIHHLF